jgi:hypothetical protein
MVKKFKKHPYSFSFSERTIENLQYYKNTHPDDKLSQQVEEFLQIIIPDMRG